MCSRCVGRSWKFNHTRPPRQGVHIPQMAQARPEGLKRIRPCVGELEEPDHTRNPPQRGVPIPQTAQAGPRGLAFIRCSVGRSSKSKCTQQPDGVSLSPRRLRQDWRDSGVSAAVWARLETQSFTAPPRGVPIPQTAQAGPEGIGCLRRCLRRIWKFNHTRRPTGPAYPPNDPRSTGELGCIRLCVGGAGNPVAHGTPTGRPYPPSGPGRTGGTRVYPPLCEEELETVHGTPTGHPYPRNGPHRTGAKGM